MDRRQAFSAQLQTILGSDQVHFQPPSNIHMTYPCIVYKLSTLDSLHANNDPYKIDTAYDVTYIDRKADSPIPMKLIGIRKSRFVRQYVVDGLYHTVFTIYY